MNKTKKSILFIAIFIIMQSLFITNTSALDLAGGITQITNEVNTTAKSILTIVFGTVALFCLAFTIVKAIKAFMSYKQNRDYDIVSPILGLCGTLIASLAASATFFSWFGL